METAAHVTHESKEAERCTRLHSHAWCITMRLITTTCALALMGNTCMPMLPSYRHSQLWMCYNRCIVISQGAATHLKRATITCLRPNMQC